MSQKSDKTETDVAVEDGFVYSLSVALMTSLLSFNKSYFIFCYFVRNTQTFTKF